MKQLNYITPVCKCGKVMVPYSNPSLFQCTPCGKMQVAEVEPKANKELAEVYTITDIEYHSNRFNDRLPCCKVWFKNEKGLAFHTYVDKENKNHKHWLEFLKEGIKLKNLKLKNKKKKIINADSKPVEVNE